jgi:hypothetical protein
MIYNLYHNGDDKPFAYLNNPVPHLLDQIKAAIPHLRITTSWSCEYCNLPTCFGTCQKGK